MKLDQSERDDVPPAKLVRAAFQHVRLDKPPGPAAEQTPPPVPKAPAGNRSLFDRILKKLRADRKDRREARRHVVVAPEVWIGWWSGTEFGTAYGRLINLSRTGALVVTNDRPPRRQPVWVYKHVGLTTACVRGEVLGITPAPFGSFAVRFRFAEPCPTSFCEAAVCGPAKAR